MHNNLHSYLWIHRLVVIFPLPEFRVLFFLICYLITFPHFKQIVEEAGGSVSRMDGEKFCVFDRSVLVSNGALHAKVRNNLFELWLTLLTKCFSYKCWLVVLCFQLLERIAPATEKLKRKGIDFSLWYKPENYETELWNAWQLSLYLTPWRFSSAVR